MKRKFTMLLAAATCVLGMSAQTTLSENFNAPWNPVANGWVIQNNSAPTGTASWFQGDGSVFPAFNGTANDYFAINRHSAGTPAPAGISNWLITPTVNLSNGGIFQFATRTRNTGPGTRPDRLQVLFSLGTGTGAIGSGTAAVGTFTNVLGDINASYTNNGYPNIWTVYSLTLTAIAGTQQGRFAFRYLVDDAGPNGANSDYIGIDYVTYVAPCIQPNIIMTPASANACTGATTNLTATGATTYTWNTGSNAASIAVSPSATIIYAVTGTGALNCPSTRTVMVNVTQTPTVSVNNATVCSGTGATLTANGASSYSWQPGGETTQAIVVTPTATSVYTVIGSNGTCNNTKTATVVISSSLGLVVSANPTLICSGQTSTLNASGASSYSWTNGPATASYAANPSVTTVYTVTGLSGTCLGQNTITLNVNTSPTITASSNNGTVCINEPSYTLTGSGAVNFTWTSGAIIYTMNPQVVPMHTTTGTYTYNVVGQAINGCLSQPIMFTQEVDICDGLSSNSANANLVSVFPNPFTNELKISGLNGSVEIFNTLGQIVIKSAVTESESINTSNLPKGIYIVKAYSAEGNVSKTIRVIKN